MKLSELKKIVRGVENITSTGEIGEDVHILFKDDTERVIYEFYVVEIVAKTKISCKYEDGFSINEESTDVVILVGESQVVEEY